MQEGEAKRPGPGCKGGAVSLCTRAGPLLWDSGRPRVKTCEQVRGFWLPGEGCTVEKGGVLEGRKCKEELHPRGDRTRLKVEGLREPSAPSYILGRGWRALPPLPRGRPAAPARASSRHASAACLVAMTAPLLTAPSGEGMGSGVPEGLRPCRGGSPSAYGLASDAVSSACQHPGLRTGDRRLREAPSPPGHTAGRGRAETGLPLPARAF